MAAPARRRPYPPVPSRLSSWRRAAGSSRCAAAHLSTPRPGPASSLWPPAHGQTYRRRRSQVQPPHELARDPDLELRHLTPILLSNKLACHYLYKKVTANAPRRGRSLRLTSTRSRASQWESLLPPYISLCLVLPVHVSPDSINSSCVSPLVY
jgi:hypothetical protein